jgi:hypothetical protein
MMENLQNEMNRMVAGFVAQVTELARRAAVDTLQHALGSERGTARAHFRDGGKRTSGELDKLAETFQAFVAKHPGMRIEQINKELGTSTKDLALPIRKLIAEGVIKTKGEKRSTHYFPGRRGAKRN